MIDVTDGFTGIVVTPDEIPYLNRTDFENTSPQARSSWCRQPSGARVTVEFSRSAPLSPNGEVRLCYDFEESGRLREIVGTPRLTHTTAPQGQRDLTYHYRLSHWITASSIMRFLPAPGDAAAAVSLEVIIKGPSINLGNRVPLSAAAPGPSGPAQRARRALPLSAQATRRPRTVA